MMEEAMISSIGGSLSALSAFGKKMGVTSNNVANWQSEEFKKSRTVLTEGQNRTVKTQIERIDTPGPVVAETGKDGKEIERELSNVDLAEEIPQTVTAQRGYEANLKSIQVQEETLKSVIDILG
ncbi:MAG: hypothetical protein C4530_12030 [Desulfobacteraceae bacterium]|nr:MAG: hypothetical protein C4530_12030 [Desulfobacteraceae bacterium]